MNDIVSNDGVVNTVFYLKFKNEAEAVSILPDYFESSEYYTGWHSNDLAEIDVIGEIPDEVTEDPPMSGNFVVVQKRGMITVDGVEQKAFHINFIGVLPEAAVPYATTNVAQPYRKFS